MKPQGRKVGPQRSSIFQNKSKPKRQIFPAYMIAKELEKAEQAKRVGHMQNVSTRSTYLTYSPQMRYNPDTDRALDIEEIAQQCRNAILRGKHYPTKYSEKLNETKR